MGRSTNHTGLRRAQRRFALLLSVGLLALANGCASLNSAREQFYKGEYAKADEELTKAKDKSHDQVLVLMERGTVRQAAGNYDGSANDYIRAAERAKELATYSVSEGAASLVVNDNVQEFRGTPFERTMLHNFTALDHLAVGNWEHAAVESRKIIDSLTTEEKGDFPEDAFSRYVAGFGLEMISDRSNAELQYRLANDLAPLALIDEANGRLQPAPDTAQTNNTAVAFSKGAAAPNPWPKDQWPNELVCFVLLGRSPTGREVWGEYWSPGIGLYAEIYHNGQLLGRSYDLTDTASLAFATMEKLALIKAAKTASRVAIKEGIAQGLDSSAGDGWGDLARIILIGLLEQPDVRRWETLPRWCQVARVPCPADLSAFEVVVKNEYGATVQTYQVDYPIQKNGRTYVAIFRNLPVPPLPRLFQADGP
ncbi:MAG: hypothetical protein EOM20_05875 [Spartobacteria bacterium]|nr:hypothetical protein [Spartobacteria bacterium]